jgi:hypothetical protein
LAGNGRENWPENWPKIGLENWSGEFVGKFSGQSGELAFALYNIVHAAGHKAIFDAVVKCLRYTASMASVLIFVAARGCGAYISSAH